MSTTKEEIVAANIRKQISYLEGLLMELENDAKQTPEFMKRVREVETQIRTLRSQFDS